MQQVKHRLDSVDIDALRIWAVQVLEDEATIDGSRVPLESVPGRSELGIFDAHVYTWLSEPGPHVVLWLKGHYRTVVSIGDIGFSLPERSHLLREEYAKGIWIEVSSR